ncbi:NAD(P)-binding protein [Aspergillus affinis]|uniref:NAD(P)-binding protein n=1 Tax=Aspergillus affinis TaxID=1070780 RepID=UPI0022FED05B|nr:NAD(P)-binding protein [Aspergillus affinis]KAI9045163.1 NAD(P)-binding protein [Aspergillus affinis]
MPSYLITGASRGIGFEFLRQLAADPNNLVIGLVRNKAATEEKVSKEIPGGNVHLVEGDLTDYDALKGAVAEVEKVTSSLDHLVANAAWVSTWSAYDGIGDLAANSPKQLDEDLLEAIRVNVLGNIHLFSLFLPLVKKGTAKKVITITSGMADIDFISAFDIVSGAPDSISKAAMNATYAKLSAQYKEEGILFLGISPGLVDTGSYGNQTPEQAAGAVEMVKKFANYSPGFKGPITPEESVRAVLETIHRAEISKGYAGGFVSHYGNKQWL